MGRCNTLSCLPQPSPSSQTERLRKHRNFSQCVIPNTERHVSVPLRLASYDTFRDSSADFDVVAAHQNLHQEWEVEPNR
jgi:hypothetical protein